MRFISPSGNENISMSIESTSPLLRKFNMSLSTRELTIILLVVFIVQESSLLS